MKSINYEWQNQWGTPRGIFEESELRKLEAAFLAALFFHLVPFSLVWHAQTQKKVTDTVILQNVDLIEPETEQPPTPPPVVQKPKSALEFLKMALPIFKKKEPVQEIPRELLIQPKIQEPKIVEPERLIEKKMTAARDAPEIKLDDKAISAPKIVEIAKLPQKSKETRIQEPTLKLEEVGKKAVQLPQTPSISLDSPRRNEKVVDLSALPKTKIVPQTTPVSERLVEKSAPTSYKPPTLNSQPPLGYSKRGNGTVSLDQPREVVRTPVKMQTESSVPKTKTKEEPATLQISKERVKITGPLSSRKVLKSFIPEYPVWAKIKNIEADVAIRFTVSAGGDVLEAVVERTSGYPQLDKSAITELKKWKFSTLETKEGDQWGIITFRFLLE